MGNSNVITDIVSQPVGIATAIVTVMITRTNRIVQQPRLLHVMDSNVITDFAFHYGRNATTMITVVITVMNTMAVIPVCNEVS